MKGEFTKETQNIAKPKSTLWEQGRALGLCFKFGKEYHQGHQRKVQMQMLLGQDGELEIEEETDKESTEEEDKEVGS